MKLQELLAEFDGLDADGVAAKLRAEGVKGKRHKCRECPMTVYLKKHGVMQARVHSVVADDDSLPMAEGQCFLPLGVREFVGLFDMGDKYGDLVA